MKLDYIVEKQEEMRMKADKRIQKKCKYER